MNILLQNSSFSLITILFPYVVGWLALAFAISIMGESREIGVTKALVYSVFFTPLVGLVMTIRSKTRESQEDFEMNETPQSNKQSRKVEKLNSSLKGELRKLKDLKKSGNISEKEFRALKSQIVNSI